MSATNQFPPPHLIPEDEDSNTNQNKDADGSVVKGIEDSNDQSSRPQLALPAPNTQDNTHQLELTGTDKIKHTFRFDSLGPMVINKDGTLSRIHNWAAMTDAERERTMRVLGKRNMLRKEAILKEEAGEKSSSSER